MLQAAEGRDGPREGAKRLRQDPRPAFDVATLELDHIRRIIGIRQEHLRRIDLQLIGFDDLVRSLATWDGPLHLVSVENAGDDGVVLAIYADLHRDVIAGCVVATDSRWHGDEPAPES
jgi:hypothetical protein